MVKRKNESKSRSTQVATKKKKVSVTQEDYLSSLPMEILVHIFSFLHRDDLLRATSVCTTWKSLILDSKSLLRHQLFNINCGLRFTKNRKNDLLFCAHNFGPHFETLSVKCQHTCLYGNCEKITKQFKLFLSGLIAPELTSFKVSGLQMRTTRNIVIKSIASALTTMFSKSPLKTFKMPEAYWAPIEGQLVLDAVFQRSRTTLETLKIDDFLNVSVVRPIDLDWLLTGLTSLTKLTKLSINIHYLTDESVVSLAQARRGELAYLSLWTTFIFPASPLIKYDSWKYLVKSCPDMEVAFRIVGYVSEPHLSLPRLFDSVLPVTKLKIQIKNYNPAPSPAYRNRMHTVLEHVRNHYGKRLKSFKLEVDNQKKHFDQALIELVRECPRLVYVRLPTNGEIQLKQLNESSQRETSHKMGPYERVRADSPDMGEASRLEDPINRRALTERLNNSLKT